MPKINVIKPFNLNRGGEIERFEIGEHDVDKDTADHWYVQAHVQAKEPKAEKAKEPKAAEGDDK